MLYPNLKYYVQKNFAPQLKTMSSPFCNLRISSAHNKWRPTEINIAQILHLSNFFELKHTLVYINLQLRTRKVSDIQLVMSNYFRNIAVQNVNKGFVYITDLTWSLSFGIAVLVLCT